MIKRFLILAMIVFMLIGCIGCSTTHLPFKITVDDSTLAVVRPMAASFGYIVGYEFPVEAAAFVLAAEVMAAANVPLQNIMNLAIDELGFIKAHPYLRLQGEEILKAVNVEMVDGEILVDDGNVLAEEAFLSFFNGIK